MTKRLLIVEDEELTARAVSFAFEREGLETEVVSTGDAALAAVRSRPPDAVILDVLLPGGMNGFDLCRQLRAETPIPIVIVSARGSETDRILGLDRGADDYITKPFSMHELVMRIQAVLRRVELDQRGETVCVAGDVAIDLARREVEVAGKPAHVTPSEFKLLALLARRAGEVVSRDELMAELWSQTAAGSSTRTCDAHVRRLRAKIEADPARPRRLVTVRGLGYRLAA